MRWSSSTGDIIDSCALPNNIAGTNPPVAAEPPQDIHGCFPGVTVNGQTVGGTIASIMDSLTPVDVELGSVVSFGYNQNGERDVASYIQHVKPRYFIPNHLTAVAAEGSSLEWKDGFYEALTARNVPPATWPIV